MRYKVVHLVKFNRLDLNTYTENNRFVFLLCLHDELSVQTLIARFMGPTWGSSDRSQVGHALAPCTLLSGNIRRSIAYTELAGGKRVPLLRRVSKIVSLMMTSTNGNIFRVTGPLCGEFTGPRWIPAQRPVTRSFDIFFDLLLNKRLSKKSWGWWFETLSRSLWRHCNVLWNAEQTELLFWKAYTCTNV